MHTLTAELGFLVAVTEALDWVRRSTRPTITQEDLVQAAHTTSAVGVADTQGQLWFFPMGRLLL